MGRVASGAEAVTSETPRARSSEPSRGRADPAPTDRAETRPGPRPQYGRRLQFAGRRREVTGPPALSRSSSAPARTELQAPPEHAAPSPVRIRSGPRRSDGGRRRVGPSHADPPPIPSWLEAFLRGATSGASRSVPLLALRQAQGERTGDSSGTRHLLRHAPSGGRGRAEPGPRPSGR